MNKHIKALCEKLDWNIYEYDNNIELEKFSPAGEDFFFCVNKKDFIENVCRYAEDFDADEHAEMWIANMHSTRGVPQSIRALIDDADAIKEMLVELAKYLKLKTKKGGINNG